jgi:pyruvate ferredoxin oxidoreductase gamma subunit/2-oxoisovalerate ferredoxin oxidoreductase gamma subunit
MVGGEMVEIRFHGRGGQGAVIASEILASALFKEGYYCQTFPEFGVERRGAPVQAFLRFDKKPIVIRYKVYEPDHIIILDPVLLAQVNVTEGLKPKGTILINSNKEPSFYSFPDYKVAVCDATQIALKYRLGTKTAPIVNTAMLGAFVKINPFVSLASVLESIKEYVQTKQEENILACKEAYEKVRVES